MSRPKPIKKTKERKEFEDAVYQYLIDHGHFTGNFWTCTIHFKDKKDLFWRTKSRMFGIKRNDEEEARAELKEFLWAKMRNDKFSKTIEKIEKGSDVLLKVVLFVYRKSRDYIRKWGGVK